MSANTLRRGPYILLILLALVPFLLSSQPVNALNCQIVRFNVDSPSNASPGQAIQVTTTINIACTQSEGGTYYTGRVDLVDSSTQTVLSRGIFTIGASPNATAAVLDNATAPQTTGPWNLEIILYIFEGGGIVALSDHPFQISVNTLPSIVAPSGPNYVLIAAVIAVVIVVGFVLLMMRKRKRNA